MKSETLTAITSVFSSACTIVNAIIARAAPTPCDPAVNERVAVLEEKVAQLEGKSDSE